MKEKHVLPHVKAAFTGAAVLLWSVLPAVSAELTFNEVTGRTANEKAVIPEGQLLLPAHEDPKAFYIVHADSLLPEGAVADAYASLDLNGAPAITIELTPEATAAFALYTADNIGQIVAVVFEGEVLTAPRIISEIYAGTALITGAFATEEAVDMAAAIRSGANVQE